MRTVTVVALRAFVHDGRRYKRGDNVTMTAIEAAAAAQQLHVSLLERPRPAANTYERRDMVPESPVIVAAPAPAPILAAQPSPTRRSRRRTRRADLVAQP